ncbi:MAG TPA: hypothetical protein VN645_13630 [Steroidobacteraceae bacterium]|nr:hypothetical protein [Steroidobacteraceae bacterium]
MKTLTKYSPLLAAPLLLASQASLAAPPSDSAYSTDRQNSHVEDATSEGIGQVNMIVCIMSALRSDAFVNKGDYNALVEESRCQPNGSSGGASSAASGDAAQAATYMTAVVNATRQSNSTPMISKIWLSQEEEGHRTDIDVHLSATAAPTANNPYGVFTLYYCGHEVGDPNCRMNGVLEGSTDGVRYFHTETRDDGQGIYTQNVALKLNASGTATGSGRMLMQGDQGSNAFDFAYDPNLYLRSDGSAEQCFARDANDPETGMSVWRYGLYDETTGARITRNSGFPIDYVHGGETYHGYLGYYGLSLPAAAMTALQNGDTVQKVDYSGGQSAVKTDYTVLKSGGRLMKFTRQTRTLQQIDRVRFNAFFGPEGAGLFSGAQPNTQYEMYWDETAGNFKVTGGMNCSNNGCQLQPLSQEQTVSVSFWQTRPGVQGWSQSLGGEIFIALQGATGSVNSSSIQVVYRTQDLVYPSQFGAIPTLYCVRECPTPASMTAYFANGASLPSPFVAGTFNNWNPTAPSGVVTYQTDAATALLRIGGQAVTFTDADALHQHSQYQYGIRSGRLVANLAAAECSPGSGTYCDMKINDADVYYQWETGAESHNQFAAVKDSSGQFVAFDAPLQVNFQVPNGVAYGDYAGQSMVLQYGGFGDLWGLPGVCVSRDTNAVVSCDTQNSRYVPAFVIPNDLSNGRVSSGGHSYLVKWLDREIRFAKKSLGTCSAAQLHAPVGVVLPTSALLKNPASPNSDVYVGVKPIVTSAVRVIHGEIKY